MSYVTVGESGIVCFHAFTGCNVVYAFRKEEQIGLQACDILDSATETYSRHSQFSTNAIQMLISSNYRGLMSLCTTGPVHTLVLIP